MDGSTLEHSDSDSGESWTLLEPCPGDDAPDVADHHPLCNEELGVENIERDEDTDGISIISDSEPESPSPCDLSYDKCLLEDPPAEPQTPDSTTPVPRNNLDDHKSIGGEDFLGDGTKLKTYVHRRNKRVSTMLNIIVLGSVITAAGVALGHMWGARRECSHAAARAPSLDRVLSSLYRLQEENAALRARLRQLAPPAPPHRRCTKMFEQSLTTENIDKLTKCVDDDGLLTPDYEKEFLTDIEKLRNVYQQNKSWLDDEIAKRMKRDLNKINNNLKSPKSIRINEEQEILKNDSFKKPDIDITPSNAERVINVMELSHGEVINSVLPEKKITYADSLKSEHKLNKRENMVETPLKRIKDRIKKIKTKEFDTISENSLTDEDLKKDDRYIPQKYKPERKKNDRHKIHKKQKRRNKYEQWEMKGGYMKDYDEFSVTSAHENDFVLKNPDKNRPSRDFERENYIDQFADEKKSLDGVEGDKTDDTVKREKGKGKEATWYDKRATLRSQARRKLEHELFGTPATAQWYFRRMQRREQCRAKPDNATHRRLPQRLSNYKTKH